MFKRFAITVTVSGDATILGAHAVAETFIYDLPKEATALMDALIKADYVKYTSIKLSLVCEDPAYANK